MSNLPCLRSSQPRLQDPNVGNQDGGRYHGRVKSFAVWFFIAIVVVLKVLDGRPFPDLRFGLTPNVIIGLLATFAEFLLIAPVSSAIGQLKWLRALHRKPMDDFRAIYEASRGPWGSVVFLARRKGGYVRFVSFGPWYSFVLRIIP